MVTELLETLTRRGIYLWTEGDALRYRAPEKALDSRLRSEIVRLKPEILELLRRREAAQQPAEALGIVADPPSRHEPFPLTDIQEAYWIGRSGLLELGDISAHTYQEFDFPSLDLPRFEQAWRRLVERHEMLRAELLPDGVQRILPAGETPPFAIAVEDLRGLPPEAVEQREQEVRQRMSTQGPDPGRWPPFEIRALLLAGDRVRLAISVSLLICDALSFRVLLRELRHLYERPDAALEELALSFRDYVLALNAARETPAFRRALEYWTSRLETLPPGPDLPLAQSPGRLERHEFRRRRTVVPAEAWARLREQARRCGVTPTVALATAYAEVLAAWSGSRRFTLNLLFFNRLPVHPQVESVVGNFSSTILLEVDATPVESFEARAGRLQQQLWRDLEHSQVSGVRVLREWNRTRPAGARVALPVVLASTLNLVAPAGAAEAGAADSDLRGELVYGCLQTPQVWLDHQVAEQEDGSLAFNWDVVEALFPPGMIDDMAEAYRGLLERLAAGEEAWGLPVPPLTPAAHLAQRAAVNATEAPLSDALLHDLFACQTAGRAGSPAVIAGDGERLTYGDLDRLSALWARRLRQAGARPGEVVAVVMEKGWEQIAAVLAVLRAGGAYLPADPALPAERLAYLLTHAGARRALTQPHLLGRLDWPAGVEPLAPDREAAAGDLPSEAEEPVGRPGDLAYILYTSGSTGVPKGVAIDHRGPVNTVADMVRRFRIGPQDRVLALSSLSFDLSVFDLFGPFSCGGAVVVPSAAESREPARWTELVRRERVTIWNSVPALMGMWVDFLEGQPAGTAPACLRLVLLSGDWIPVSLPDRIRALFPEARVISLGGATEASIWSILYPISEVYPGWQSIPYGRPMANQRMYVLDDRLEHRPTWVPGELYIGGVGVALGYWRDEERTRQSFPRHPRTEERLYRTGDLGRFLPDGEIEFLGRRDFQVKVQGYRIELGEIETALSRHPGVGSAVVAALGEPRGEKRLVAYVVPSGEAAPAAAELREHLRGKLPDYMVPSAFVFLEALPLTSNGKIDRPALARLDAARPAAADRVPPRDRTEAALAEVWQELLGGGPVGVTDNFFELGGYSLLAVRLMARIRSRFGRDLSLAALVAAPTIEQLARRLADGAGGDADSPLVALQPSQPGSRPPFFCVHPVGGSVLCYADLARRLGRGQPFYGLQLTEPAAAEGGIEALAERYLEALVSVQPRGPYRLGGWSMGGVIAFEMARRLRERGELVALLALIDAAAPAAAARELAPDLSEDEMLAWWAADLWGLNGAPPPLGAMELQGLAPDEALAAVLARAQGEGVLPAELDLAAAERLFALFRANARALGRFAPRPYPGQVLLVRGRQGTAANGDPRWGWGALAAEVDVTWLDGDHFSLVQEPRVAALAELLAERLKREPA